MSAGRARTRTRWTRRFFLAAAATLVAALVAGFHRLLGAVWSARWALDDVPDPPALLQSPTGRLLQQEKRELFELARAIEEHWQLGTQLTRAELDFVLDLKTGSPPSYLEEYRSAVQLFSRLRRDASPAEALRSLLEAPRRGPNAESSLEAHARDRVVAEFLNLALIRGGFRRFGVENYAGYTGGPAGYRRVRAEKTR